MSVPDQSNPADAGELVKNIGNGMMSCGCMLMLIPIIALLIFLFFAVIIGLASGG